MKARVHVTLKSGVHDPQGKAIRYALSQLGYESVDDVRAGRLFELELSETDPEKAHAQVDRMCRDLLANTVVETYDIELSA